MKLYVGLGNPGIKYALTRHNMGFMAIDYMASKLQLEISKAGCKGVYGKTKILGEDLILFKPLTYMNLSGEAVRSIMDFFKVSIEDVVIVYDDLALPVGKIRIREKGSSGGQNGIKNIIEHLGTDEIKRIRIGIGNPMVQTQTDFVLGRIKQEEEELIKEALHRTYETLIDFITLDFKKVMSRNNPC